MKTLDVLIVTVAVLAVQVQSRPQYGSGGGGEGEPECVTKFRTVNNITTKEEFRNVCKPVTMWGQLPNIISKWRKPKLFDCLARRGQFCWAFTRLVIYLGTGLNKRRTKLAFKVFRYFSTNFKHFHRFWKTLFIVIPGQSVSRNTGPSAFLTRTRSAKLRAGPCARPSRGRTVTTPSGMSASPTKKMSARMRSFEAARKAGLERWAL